MTYEFIINPITNRKVSIHSKKGRSIVKNYLIQAGGARNAELLAQLSERCQGLPERRCESRNDCKTVHSKETGAYKHCRKRTGNRARSGITDLDDRLDSNLGRVLPRPRGRPPLRSNLRSNDRSSRSNDRSSSHGSQCSDNVNVETCPPGCDKITIRSGKRSGDTYCRKKRSATRGRSRSRSSSRSSSRSRSRSSSRSSSRGLDEDRYQDQYTADGLDRPRTNPAFLPCRGKQHTECVEDRRCNWMPATETKRGHRNAHCKSKGKHGALGRV